MRVMLVWANSMLTSNTEVTRLKLAFPKHVEKLDCLDQYVDDVDGKLESLKKPILKCY